MDNDYPQIVDEHGQRGYVIGPSQDASDEIEIQMEDGREISVPASALTRQEDGSWYLDGSPETMDRSPEDETVIPVVAEELDIQKRKRPTGKVRVIKSATERHETVSMPLVRERAEVRRVVVDRPVDGPVAIRREGDTIILPIMEEVAVVEKRRVLKEELHITRRREVEQHEQTVNLVSEQAHVERTDAEGSEVDSGVEEVPQHPAATRPSILDPAESRPSFLTPDPAVTRKVSRRNKIVRND